MQMLRLHHHSCGVGTKQFLYNLKKNERSILGCDQSQLCVNLISMIPPKSYEIILQFILKPICLELQEL